MHKKTKKTKKLALNRETLKSLNDDALNAIAGGCNDTCFCTGACGTANCPSCMMNSCGEMEF